MQPTDGGRLRGRRILITGAASGIGRATARLFAREGAATALLDLQAAKLNEVAAQTGGLALVADLAVEDSVLAAVTRAAEELNGLDGVVNCAGVAGSRPLAELERDHWDLLVLVNLTAPYIVCRAALPALAAAGRATIVNIASAQALLPNARGASAYAASKAGLVAFTKAIAAELAPTIRANAVAPGIVATPMVEHVLKAHGTADPPPFLAQYALRRAADPEEIAKAILFLTSEESSYVTGSVLAVDGGRAFH